MAEASSYVLVVEDHPGLRAQLRETLEEAGLEVVTTADARAAIVLLNTRVPALVVADLVLPEGSGYDVCEHIRRTKELALTPVLVISGRALPSDRAFAEEAGADAILAKPFGLDEFLAQVKALLSPAHKRQTTTEAA